ncbi:MULTISPECIES: hydrogenase maturation nickel metallochaperone HypA [Halorussus]|uniref:hydrogenase maturation nickel metallochaperone HypA n=1 Tax=Halorussus TaxID=1070314 RepID=UPI0013B4158B|nr:MULTISPECIES: hydrogenase maturation nickel metallochaperone HypA [Halorussus]NHN59036.1 hydrogenase maturation nickel metallochaperone HypA [Halorussus sp. JP-T4]
MGIVDTIRDMLVPDNEPGVALECTDCGATFEEPYGECPECGSSDVKEIEGFDMRPDT